MSIINNILDSVEHYLVTNPNIKAFIYTDNTLNQELTGNVKNDLVGTETQFIIQNNGLDLTSLDYPNFLLYRYLSFNGELRQIIAYDNLTGEVTIDSAFGIPITTSDSINITLLDSIFIYEMNSFDDKNGTRLAQKTILPLYFRVTTKDDIKANRNKEIIEQIKNTFYSNNFNLKIYKDNNFTDYDSMTMLGNGNFNSNVIDVKNNDYTYLANVVLNYFVVYK